jgi:photosystem II stability/assembly factor-like uncharacterized protein
MKRALLLLGLAPALLVADSLDARMFAEMHWRSIGPLRGGRSKAVTGVASQPNVLYIGVCNGGVWKTEDYGRTWFPIFDNEPTGSIGALAVAPSDPNVIYAGSGEGLHRPDLSVGDGIYKSTDAGKTWTHLGLRDGQQIPRIAVDPHNPDRLFVAVLGHPYGPNEERGVYRSEDGGKTFEKVFYKDENTGASDVAIDPSNPDIVYAALWEAREGPWENAAWAGTGGGIYKSTDGGRNWRQLLLGLGDVIQANIAIAPSNPRRLYASVANEKGTGIYRSDDAGENWTRITDDPRPATRIGGGDVSVPAVDPKDPDTVYSTSIVTWKSTDGGKTWTALRGAPGGDDYQRMWINPEHPDILLIAGDQGAIVTVNGGKTWSSWYNQPTAQMYHVNTDNAFPYRVCSGQQESGSACVASRGNDGAITFRDWHPVGAEEYGYAVPDPLNPDLVYGGKISRYDRRTGQVENVSPEPLRSRDFRVVRTAPIVFSPKDPHLLYFASNTLWVTADGGRAWKKISPDLTRKTWEIPASVGKYSKSPTAQPTDRGVIYAVAPSPLDTARIWAGTDDGLIQTTADGGATWHNVTPPQLVPWAKVSILDAGHFDALTAYAAINTIRLDDMHPHILRTHDGGKTWTEIVTGLPDDAPVDVVREDPLRKGLLFAGTERAVYVSFDDGGHWQSLRLNMPATSVRDLAIKDDDLVAGTHGRGFWILDDITPLRQATPAIAATSAYLFKPEPAIRVRWDMNTDTPLPPDEPQCENPPDGAIIDYFLGKAADGPVTLEIHDAAGALVRRYASSDPVPPPDPMLAIPSYWVRPPHPLSAEAGMHRFLWDMHYIPLPGGRGGYGMGAVLHDTPLSTTSIWAMPGRYTVKLTVDGKTYTQPLTLKMDPRVKTPPAGLEQQFTLSKQIYEELLANEKAHDQLRALRKQLQAHPAGSTLEKQAAELEGAPAGGRGGRGAPMTGPETLSSSAMKLSSLLRELEAADVSPTTQLVAAVAEAHTAHTKLMARWSTLKGDASRSGIQ